MKIANRYDVIKEIGKGGMANVYLAFDTILKRPVAVKVLKGDMTDDPVALERFKREANASTKLSHPNAVDIYDVGEDENNHYIVMEYVKGHTLKQLLKRRGALGPREAVWIMKQLASALLEAHKNGIIHRDIKSQNVLIKDDGTVKLADFGIAVVNNAMQITSKGSVLGSVHYLAPELAKGGQATMQSDIYSLGIVFYELLTGDVPFKADTPIQVALLHVRNNVPSVREFNPDIPQAVENIIIKATARSLEDRYANVALLIKDLNRCLSPEAENDEKVVLAKSDQTTYEKVRIAGNADETIKKKKDKKADTFFNVLFITIISIVSVVAILLILLLTGVIGTKNKMVEVPDISGLSLTVAKDVLSASGLSIDDSEITWMLTDDVPANQIISFTPAEDTKVEKGTKIKVTVSEGTYQTMANYVGRDLEEVKAELKALNFNVETVAVESEEAPGTIVAQEGLLPDDKYNPNVVNTVRFSYSAYRSSVIPFGTLGRNVNDVYNEFSYAGFKVTKEKIDYNTLTEEEKAYGAGTVVRVTPSEGSLYTQEEDSEITLYYFD
ncbi:MAG: Stk1 family PASTA domain-containing Ser/Thr kinase [Erysipelotrichaceae bacterium]|nr:Stk1 family PASTA domain-containing Ser/Thr kinase [Erysipelotrichaceae bacterium]